MLLLPTVMQHHWRTEKILSLEQAREKADELRAAGKRLVTINGAFDLLHAGHLDILEEAKQQGDVLVVGINSDESIRAAKGPSRPIISQAERAAMLAALACVDYVTIVDAPYSEMPQRLLETIRPAVHVNSIEYDEPEKWIEWPTMQKVGATGHAVERRPGLATSDIIKKIKET